MGGGGGGGRDRGTWWDGGHADVTKSWEEEWMCRISRLAGGSRVWSTG